MLIAAVHHAGLASLPTPQAPWASSTSSLVRPTNERPFLILVVGFPAEDARVPVIGKKVLPGIATFDRRTGAGAHVGVGSVPGT